MAYGNIVGQTGEGFSKDEILTGATANKFGLSDAAVPNDVFDFLGKFNQHWWRRRKAVYVNEGSDWEYVTSSNRSAYPDNGEKDGYTYEYLGVPYDNIKAVPRISIGYYNGTNKYGKNYPNRITFDFKPTLLTISSLGLYSNIEQAFQWGTPEKFQFWFMPHTWNRQSFEMPIGGGSGSPNKAKWVDNTTLEWYSEKGALEQFNYGYGYFYIAIG